jgi:hypothetical protein
LAWSAFGPKGYFCSLAPGASVSGFTGEFSARGFPFHSNQNKAAFSAFPEQNDYNLRPMSD